MKLTLEQAVDALNNRFAQNGEQPDMLSHRYGTEALTRIITALALVRLAGQLGQVVQAIPKIGRVVAPKDSW